MRLCRYLSLDLVTQWPDSSGPAEHYEQRDPRYQSPPLSALCTALPMTRRLAHHRFGLGDHVYLRPARHEWLEESFVITGYRAHRGWPHYELMAPDGSLWHASQLDLLTSPISRRFV